MCGEKVGETAMVSQKTEQGQNNTKFKKTIIHVYKRQSMKYI